MEITKEDIISYVKYRWPDQSKNDYSWQWIVVHQYIDHRVRSNEVYIATKGHEILNFTLEIDEVIAYSVHRKINSFLDE
jgi:hypothetical protein